MRGRFPSSAPAAVPPLMSAFLVGILFLLGLNHASPVRMSHTYALQKERRMTTPLYDCPRCINRQDQSNISSTARPDGKDIDIMVTYSDPSGAVQVRSVRSMDLSASWVWKSPGEGKHDQSRSALVTCHTIQFGSSRNTGEDSNNDHQSGDETPESQASPVHPVKLKRQMLRRERRERRTTDLIKQDKEMDNQMQEVAIAQARELDTTIRGKYSIWRKEYENPNSDSTVKLMRDQIIMARAYAAIAKSKNESVLYDSLIKHSRESQLAIGEAITDAELLPSAIDQAKAMGHVLATAKDQLYDCVSIARKLRVMLQSSETNTIYLYNYEEKDFPNQEKLEDTSLYHYAIFSDNVLATSVVVNSTVLHAKEPEKHVFHIVTDKLNFAAMRMWFLVNDSWWVLQFKSRMWSEFTWLTLPTVPVLRQLESARMIEYYFKAHQTSSLTAGSDNLKYRNPKYLSMLNHLRFYLPEVYPKLDKVLFLDDDIVVQKDLTPLWSVNLHGMVNGAVETCKESFHRFDKYLNFSNPKISENFDPNACGWAFGMNIFDLREWRKRDITGIYHHWQDMNEDRTLWKLGTLPPGLITFYNLTYPLDRSWHVLGLGYDPALNQTEIDNAAVVHYNGNYKHAQDKKKLDENMQQYLLLVLLCFFSTPPSPAANHISINCGSSSSATEWLPDGDGDGDLFTIHGSSSTTSTTTLSGDPVHYNTARISSSQFSYTFQLNPGQKFIRLHFNPSALTSSSSRFKPFHDLFTVEAGPFTLLSNFSASSTAHALSVNTFVKEFCITLQENQPLLNLIFSPTPLSHYAFINGIEIISLPSTLSYCHGGDIGVQVVGNGPPNSLVYIDNTTALEMVHRQSVNRRHSNDFLLLLLQGQGEGEGGIKMNNISSIWKVSVDVGFSYLVRLHFSEIGLKLADFQFLINHMLVSTSADILQAKVSQVGGNNNNILWYNNYMVMIKGHKREGKRDIFISLQSQTQSDDHGHGHGHAPLEGFEIFKLSNHDNSLASPSPSLPPPPPPTPHSTFQFLFRLLGPTNSIATLVITVISLVNVIVHILQQNQGANFADHDGENKPSARAKRLCRLFLLAEIQSATGNFNDAFVIGKGGFGKVYKGLIDKGQQTVAIKRLKSDSRQGKREFWTEIEVLSELRHVNLVSLIGYCNEQREMILVYEHMPFGTLADHLYKLARKSNIFPSLSWKQRLSICIGAGRGLDYLHTGHGVIHRDVKASNVLLDENFVAKVSDFGLAKTETGSLASTNLKGTFGYFDPDYFKTRKLTTKSDAYSFGVVLLEVLCGRQAVEPWLEEDKRSLTMWARDNISKGEVDQIVDPSLRGEISQESLKAFLRVAERCLHDEPKKRPTMAHIVINLEFALEQQENVKSLLPNQIISIPDVFPFTAEDQQENVNTLVPNDRSNVASAGESKLPNEVTSFADPLPFSYRTIRKVSQRQPTMASSNVQSGTFTLKEEINSKMINARKKDWGKTTMHKLSRLLPWDAFWNTGKPSKRKGLVNVSVSAPISRRTRNMTLRGSTDSEKNISGMVLPSPNLSIFSLSELKAATRNFSNDRVLGEGGFGRVYKGLLKEKSSTRNGSGSIIAVKKLNHESMQGIEEWKNEVNFLGRLSHPNLVKLLGYCWEDKELMLVYEFMQKGSLDMHLFRRGSAIEPLPWDIRLKILIGAARGLAFLHGLDTEVIYRDFKASNILLDESYHAKLSDFGLAKLGPTASSTHVSTRVLGTYGYACPEYIATGHLSVKSDVYGFGVVVVEMLTGLRALDTHRSSEKRNLVEWIKPYLGKRSKLKKVMDSGLEGRYHSSCAVQIGQLALNCLENVSKKRPSAQEVAETLERMDSSASASAVEKARQPRVRFG
ncbi:putative galacturonosyltransferase 3 [Sesamum alatum]|uniref:non-specific serine/threonine protein kinase n=1 Tax=Sesamum alatum TaxID=300844 RepID=A0AAE2CWZ9_9LAMI|nr:putative galacturonosyltransferase 3 [Sesamum alatum]